VLASGEPLARAALRDGVARFAFRVDRGSGRHVLLEVNPRFWGSLPLAVAAGADFPSLYWDLAVHGREGEAAYRAGVVKADLTGGFNRGADEAESARGIGRVWAAAVGLASATLLLLERRTADSWAADDPEPWRGERRALAKRTRDAIEKRLPRRARRRRVRFEEAAGRIVERARGRAPRLVVIGRDNVRRSAFGERLLRLRLAGLPVEIASAGFVPRRGALPDPTPFSAAAQLGVDLAGHSSGALSVATLERADAVILFGDDTEWRLRQLSPGFTGEVVTLSDLGDDEGSGDLAAIAAALSRLARVLSEQLCPPPRSAVPLGEAGPARPQAA
jgi:protein-tyrosine-phosphatase